MPIPPGIELGRNDVVGCRVINIIQSATPGDDPELLEALNINDDSMDFVYTFYRLDSGAIFSLPSDNAGAFETEEPPRDAVSLDHPGAKPVLGQRIVNVLRHGPNADFYHDYPYLIMENGYAVTDIDVYPTEVNYAGVHVYAPEELDLSKMIDFFPMRKDDCANQIG